MDLTRAMIAVRGGVHVIIQLRRLVDLIKHSLRQPGQPPLVRVAPLR